MINLYEVRETNQMIEQDNLDVRTITLGISLLDCIDSDLDRLSQKIYDKITTVAKDLAATGKAIERDFGIPIVNKRISVTPMALIGEAACRSPKDYVTLAETLDRAAKQVGVNFIGGFSALVSKGMTKGADVVICTGGMSVDPDDKTPLAIKNTGARLVAYGAPVLPGAMFLLAYYEVKAQGQERTVAIMGLPGCVMYAKRTIFDLVLPRVMADDQIFPQELAALGQGGLCLGCPVCTFPNCGFGKGS